MRRSPSQQQWRTLRRYALAGQRDEVRRMLEEWSKTYADDPQVAVEWKRFNEGKNLLITESKQARGERQRCEAVNGIQEMLNLCRHSHTIPSSTTQELLTLRGKLREYIHTLKEVKGEAPPGTGALLRMLEGELARRQHKNTRSRLVLLGVVGAMLALLGATYGVLHHRAGTLAKRLQDARKHENWVDAEKLLHAADTGINRLVNKRVEPVVEDVKRWRVEISKRAKELTRQMKVYKRLNAISSLSLEERAHFLRRIHALPVPFSTKLLKQWDELCRPEKEILERQKREAIARFSTPISEPVLSGDMIIDLPALQQVMRTLTREIQDFEDAREALNLDAATIVPQRKLLSFINDNLHDIEQLLQVVNLLGTARSLAEHRKALSGFHPVTYPRATQVVKICEYLKKNGDLVPAMILGHRYNIPVAVPYPYPAHVMKAVTEGGPTFGPKAPASHAQVALMEDIFTSSTLRRKLYKLISYEGKVRFSEELPKETDEGHLTFEVSVLDPAYHIDESKEDWIFPEMVKRQVVDATPVLKTTGIERQTFFSRANVPRMLGQITCIRHENCPALAKAYVYNILVKILTLNADKDVLGLRFSPSLTADIESFQRLTDQLGFSLTPSCWLYTSDAEQYAEAAFADWFNNHSNRYYDREMNFNLRAILNRKPQYVGFVDINGTPRYKETRAPEPTRTLYYFSGEELKATPASAPLTDPSPLSPVFAL